VLTPFLIGAILAYLGTPIVDWAAPGASRARLRRRSSCSCSGLSLLLFLV
jgi:predicted PurR-regulated permease PerM